MVAGVDVKAQALSFAGLDANGIPVGFVASDAQGHTGSLNVSKTTPTLTNEGLVLSGAARSTDDKAINVMLDQNITVGGSGTTYSADASVSLNGNWVTAVVSNTNTTFERQSDGNYLLTAVMSVSSIEDSGILIPASRGVDDVTDVATASRAVEQGAAVVPRPQSPAEAAPGATPSAAEQWHDEADVSEVVVQNRS
jgi:hypothetical protein